MNLHLFGKVDSPCIANLALIKSGEDCNEDVKFFLNSNFYMDDYLKSMSNEKDFISLTCKVVSILKYHGFNVNSFLILKRYYKITTEYTKSKICELRIFFANIRRSFRTNLEYPEGHIYF